MFDDFKDDLRHVKESKKLYDFGLFHYICVMTYIVLKNVVPVFILLIFALFVLYAFVALFVVAPVIGVAVIVIATLVILAALGESAYYDPDQFEKRKDEEI